jgi:hypothetical protein
MQPDLYEKVFIFNEAIQSATDTLTSFGSNGHFQMKELERFADSIREVRSRATVHVMAVMMNAERSAASDKMAGPGSTPHICQ